MTDGEFDNLTVNNVLTIGADVNLSRYSANVLRTPDSIIAEGGIYSYRSSAGWCIGVKLTTDTDPTLIIDNTGKISFGNGTDSVDANLYRSESNTLETNGNFTVDNQLKLPCEVPRLSKQQILDAIYRYVGETWAPYGLPYPEDLPSSRLTLSDTTTPSKKVELFEIISIDPPQNPTEIEPLLATNVGLVVQKDIAAGGFISTNQGEIWMGHGRDNSTDPPKIILMHSGTGYPTLYLKQFNGDPAHLDLGDLIVSGFIFPSTYSHCGTPQLPWWAVYTEFTCYHSPYTDWESVDDLGLARNFKTVKETRKTSQGEEYQVDIISRESLKFLEDDDGFYRSYDVNGYLLCCIKALVLRLEALEKQIQAKN